MTTTSLAENTDPVPRQNRGKANRTRQAQRRKPVSKVSEGYDRRFGASTIAIVGGISMVGALLTGVTSFFVLTGLAPLTPNGLVIAVLLVCNIAFVLGLVGCIMMEVMNLVQARRRGTAGARLHVRIVGLFSVIAAIPAVLVSVIAAVQLDRGLDAWFSDRTRDIVNTSVVVAEAYLREHGQVTRSDLLVMATEINRVEELFEREPARFQTVFNALATIRVIGGAYILDSEMEILSEAQTPRSGEYPLPPPGAMSQAEDGRAILIAPGPTNYVSAVVRLEAFDDAYLYIVRTVNQRILQYLGQTQENIVEYGQLAQHRVGTQIIFGSTYLSFTLILVLSAIWVGIGFANRLVSPIRQLIGASREVAGGNLDVRVPTERAGGDLSGLAMTFNQMTSELKSQRNELLNVNRVMDDRRRFIETVLAGVPAGVLGVDADGTITVANRTALELIGGDDIFGKRLTEVFPEIADLVQRAEENRDALIQDQISITRLGKERIVAARVATERSDPVDHSLVVTLDDITELIQAQRTSAWADVARRIAHEIKNPLTPIQLSAERLKRKYGKTITSDRDVFDQCTDTIIRQVGDIGRMVDEFSTFARMPKPTMATDNVSTMVRETVFMMQVANPDLKISVAVPDNPVRAQFDGRLIGQALTNIIKNATEAVMAVETRPPGEVGSVDVRLRTAGNDVVIDVIDDGIGLPKENRHRLLEPYVTHRDKGTGLGLAIVARILEEHGGQLELTDAPQVAHGGRGALVKLSFPISGSGSDTETETGGIQPPTASEDISSIETTSNTEDSGSATAGPNQTID